MYDRDTPVARIVPFGLRDTTRRRAAGKDSERTAERVADLARQGILSPGDPQALADWLDRHQPIRLPAGRPRAVDVLLDRRRESTR